MYVQLTPDREFTVKLLAQLLPFHGAALSPFESQLAHEVVDRWLSSLTEVPSVTDAEWPVLAEAAQAMANAKAKQALTPRARYSVEVLSTRGQVGRREGAIILCVRAGGTTLSVEQSRALRAELEAAEHHLTKAAQALAIFNTLRKPAAA